MKTFLTKSEEDEFNAEVARLRGLVKDPYAALHDLALAFNCLAGQLSAIRTRIDEDEDDDKNPLVVQIDEALKEAGDHACGTDIGMAMDHGAWLTKDGWESREMMPFLSDHPSEPPTSAP